MDVRLLQTNQLSMNVFMTSWTVISSAFVDYQPHPLAFYAQVQHPLIKFIAIGPAIKVGVFQLQCIKC